MFKDLVELVKAVPIVDVAEYLGLKPKKSGSNMYRLPCPFHAESKPSLSLYVESNIYRCFGCDAKGDVLSFVQKFCQVRFGDAMKTVAKIGNITIPEGPETDSRIRAMAKAARARAARKRKETSFTLSSVDIKKINNMVHKEVFAQEWNVEIAVKYMKNRGITPEVCEFFQIGYAPKLYKLRFLLDNYDPDQLVEASVVYFKDGMHKNYFKDRIMIPLTDQGIIGYTARAMGNGVKYLHSRSTAAWSALTHLFALDRFLDKGIIHTEAVGLAAGAGITKEKALKPEENKKKVIKHKDKNTNTPLSIVLSEGPLDVLSFYSAGVPAVANLGKEYVKGKIKALLSSADEIVLALDNDDGKNGPSETMRKKILTDFPEAVIRIAELPQGQDPNDALVDGKDLKKIVENAQ